MMGWSRNKEFYEKYKGLRVSIAGSEPGYIIGYNTKNSVSILMKVKNNGLFSGAQLFEQKEIKEHHYYVDQIIDPVGRYIFGHFNHLLAMPSVEVIYEKRELQNIIDVLEL